ncbi:MAG: LysR family transcriptional regulator [Clostridium sp.]|nr:LysR family transcriptional regulator [Clostridium sp.]
MLLRQMKYFVTIVECNSFTEAAEQMFISQSAISQQMKVLEAELNVKLINRKGRSFTLTAAGEYFYQQSKGILEQIAGIRRETVRLGEDKEHELQLKIGYVSCYSGQELHRAVAEFARVYPEVSISVINGTHEELYDRLRFGEVDLVLNDQRRAFSDEYVNFELLSCACYIEVSVHNKLSGKESVTLKDLRDTSCILIAPREQQNVEREFYQNTLGFGGSFLFAVNLEEGRLMALGNRGFLPVESVGTLPQVSDGMKRIPVYRGNEPLKRNYCAFWRKERTNYYIEEFAGILHKLLGSSLTV